MRNTNNDSINWPKQRNKVTTFLHNSHGLTYIQNKQYVGQ